MSDNTKIMGGVLGAKALTLGQFDDFLDWVNNQGEGKDAQDLYKAVAWAFWCANLRANNIARVPYAVYPMELEEDEEDEDNAIEWPIDMRPVLWLVEMWMTLAGAAYLFKRQQIANMLTDLQVLNANTMKVLTWDADGPITFRQKVGPDVIDYPAEQIVYFRRFNPYDDINKGVSGGQVATDANLLIRNANLWAAGFFQNGAIPSIILQAQGQISETDRKEIKSVWNRALGGIRHVWEVMVLRKGIEATVISPPVKDLAMPELERTKRDQILAAHLIPPGLAEAKTNRAERDALQYELWDQVLIPELEVHLGPALDRQLFEPLGLRISFQAHKVEAIQKAEIAKAESTAFLASVMSKAYEDNVVAIPEYRRVLDTLLVAADMPKLDDSFTPEERMPVIPNGNGQGNDQEGDRGSPNEVMDNIENRTNPKALAPEWGHHRVYLQS
jgi:HK97 family phage portal protein